MVQTKKPSELCQSYIKMYIVLAEKLKRTDDYEKQKELMFDMDYFMDKMKKCPSFKYLHNLDKIDIEF